MTSSRPLPRGGAVENLLRVAHLQCGGLLAFATMTTNGNEPRSHTFASDASHSLSADAVAELSRQASADPEFVAGRVFVRSVRLGEALTLAVAPVASSGTVGVLAIVAEAGRQFSPAQLAMLGRLAGRLGRHVAALHTLHASRVPAMAVASPTAHEVPRARASAAAITTSSPTSSPTSPRSTGRAVADPAAAPFVGPATSGADVWWAESDPVTGLLSLGQFFSRTGRLLAAEVRTTASLALVLIEVPDERTAPAAADALRAQLRFTDPLTRVDRELFAAAVPLFPGGTHGDAVEERLGVAVRSALDWLSPVRTTHVLAEPGDRRDVDELLRRAIASMPRRAGGSGAPWRGTGGSAARLPFP